MTNEPSPRPWRIGESAPGTMSCIHDANGEHIASCFGMPAEAVAALIVDAVSERDRLRAALSHVRNVLRGEQMTKAQAENQARFIDAALGAGETPTGKGVGR